MKSEHTYTYQGRGDFLMGVPARHLTKEDVDALAPEARHELSRHMRRQTGLYQKPKHDEGTDKPEPKGNRRKRAKVATVNHDADVTADEAKPDDDWLPAEGGVTSEK